jgi:hypothetical protein
MLEFLAARTVHGFARGAISEIRGTTYSILGNVVRPLTLMRGFREGPARVSFPRWVTNLLWKSLSDREIELPGGRLFAGQPAPASFLEVGNVLSYYYRMPIHDIVDKFDRTPGILNVDVVDFAPSLDNDLIISISTLEHVGFDESPKDPTKFLRSVRRLEKSLAPAGRLLFTVPLGYNPAVDQAVVDGELCAFELAALRRDASTLGEWREVSIPNEVGAMDGILFAAKRPSRRRWRHEKRGQRDPLAGSMAIWRRR